MANAYIQMVGGEYLDDFIYTAVEPLIQRGFKIIKVENNFQNEQPQINDVCVGSVEFTCEFFNRIGIKIPKPLGYPKELNEFFARKIDKRLLSSIIPKEYPIFIKPQQQSSLQVLLFKNQSIWIYYFLVYQKTHMIEILWKYLQVNQLILFLNIGHLFTMERLLVLSIMLVITCALLNLL